MKLAELIEKLQNELKKGDRDVAISHPEDAEYYEIANLEEFDDKVDPFLVVLYPGKLISG